MNTTWIRYLPAFARRRLEGRQNLQKVIGNTGWLFADKILRMGVGLLVGVWVARYLGTEQFGQLNYAIAFVGIFGAIAGMGLNGIVVRDIVRGHDDINTTLGTAFVLQVIGSMFSIALIIGAITFLHPDDTLTNSLVAILGISLVFKSTDVVKYWFESQVRSRYVVWIENGVFVIISGVKIYLILQQSSLIAFVWITLVEALLVAVGLLGIYSKKGGHLSAWKPSLVRAKSLLSDCWPLIFSSLAVMIYLRIDQIMLAEMVGDHAVGIYAAAVRISEVWYFIPMSIAASILPSIIKAKQTTEAFYEEQLQKLYDLMVALALAIAIPMTFLSNLVVAALYGRAYLGAGTVLSINIWAGVFVFLGTACGVYTNIENLPRYSFFQTLLGMLVNITLNLVMIPLWGVNGAALATVISYAIATFSVLIFTRTRHNGLSMLRALNILRRFCSI